MIHLKKHILTLALLIVTTAQAWADGGTCGDGVTWSLSGGTLTIGYSGSGTGVMNDFEDDYRPAELAPWSNSRDAITSLVVEDGVTFIGRYAFYKCTALTSVTLPASVTIINNQAFEGCTSLTEFTFPPNVTQLFTWALRNCSSLKEVTVLATDLEKIYADAFKGCSSLTTITFYDETPCEISDVAFNNYANLKHIYVPAGSVDAYKMADGWNYYSGIISAKPTPVPVTWDAENQTATIDAMPAGNVTFLVEYEDPLLTLKANTSEMGYVGIVQQRDTKAATLTTSQTSDGRQYSISTDASEDAGYYVNNESNSKYVNLVSSPSAMADIAYVIFYGPNGNSYRMDHGQFIVYLKDGKTYKDSNCTEMLWEGGVSGMVIYAEEYGLPDGVTQNSDGTYTIVPGTTVTIEAVPYQHHYFTGWTGTTETATTFTLTVEEDMTLEANFAAFPTLTLASNDATKGTVVIQPVEGEAMVAELVAKDLVGEDLSDYLPSGIDLNAPELATGDEEWSNSDTESTFRFYVSRDVDVDVDVSRVVFYGPRGRYVAEKGFDVFLKGGNTYKYPPCDQLLWEGGVTRVQIFTKGDNLPAGVAVKNADAGTYSVAPGTSLTVTATPAVLNYFKNWTEGTTAQPDALSTTTATYTKEMPSTDLAVTANFVSYPTLTIATNDDQMGSVEIPNNTYMTLEYSIGTTPDVITVREFPYTVSFPNNTEIGQITDPHPSAVSLTDGGQVIISEPCDGDFSVRGASEDIIFLLSCHVRYVATPVANTTDQFQVAPGTTLTLAATAAENCHVEGWTDAADDAYDTDITYSDYTISSPSQLFPGKSALALTMGTADQTATANFALNGYLVTVPSKEYITYCADKPVTLLSTETEAALYTITSVSGSTATLSPVSKASAGMPLLIYNSGTTEKTVLLQITTAPDTDPTVYSGFHGTLTATTIPASVSGGVSNYALNGKQFVIVRSGLEIGANKCWLSVEAPSGARAISLVLGDTDATGIDAISGDPGNSSDPAASGDYYDLNGRRLDSKPTRKGVYIQNGRKVVVK